jgi:hypothetical protein
MLSLLVPVQPFPLHKTLINPALNAQWSEHAIAEFAQRCVQGSVL